MDHYVCTGGCGGVSDAPGVCLMEGCPKNGETLEVCSCGDGEHGEVMEKARREQAEMNG